MEWAALRLGRGEHAFICGLTGSGKSELAWNIIDDPFKSRYIIYDPKHTRTFEKWQGQTFIYSWSELVRSKEKRIVYRPSRKPYVRDGRLMDETEDPDAQDEFFAYCFDRGGTRVVVDECAKLVGGSRPSYHARQCWTQGREIELSMVGLTQRPVDIPLILMSESRKIFMFRLNMEEDQQRLRKITGFSEERQRSLKEFEFLVWDYKWGAYPNPLKLNLSGVPSPHFMTERSANATT